MKETKIDFNNPEEVVESLSKILKKDMPKEYCGPLGGGWYYCFGVFMRRDGWNKLTPVIKNELKKQANERESKGNGRTAE